MHSLKCGTRDVQGSELLAILMRPDGSRTELDDSVAQVVTIRTSKGNVTVLVLAPKKAFELEIEEERAPLSKEEDWFRQWDRMMVLRSKEGSPGGEQAEATLLGELRRHLARNGPQGNFDAEAALCREVFGEELHNLQTLLVERRTMRETDCELQCLDDVCVVESRPVVSSELEELSALVHEDWRPVLQRTIARKTHSWNDVEATGPTPEELVLKRAKYACWAAAGIFTLGICSAAICYTIRATEEGTAEFPPKNYCPQRGVLRSERQWKDRFSRFWKSGFPVPREPCGTGTLYCRKGESAPWHYIEYGSPWVETFPRIWDESRKTVKYPPNECIIACRTPEETSCSLATRLVEQFPLTKAILSRASNMSLNTFPTMSPEDQVQKIFAELALDPGCSGKAASLQKVGSLAKCFCDIANVNCDVLDTNLGKNIWTTLTDVQTSIIGLARSFSDYPEQLYEVNNCTHECFNFKAPNE